MTPIDQNEGLERLVKSFIFLFFFKSEEAMDEWTLPEEDPIKVSSVSEANREWYHILASRLLYTQAYAFFYFFMLLLGLVILIWTLVDFVEVSSGGSAVRRGEDRHPVLLALDVILVTCLTLEVSIRYVATKDIFFDKCSNYWDVVLTFLCCMSLVLGFILPKSSESEGVTFFMFLETFLLFIRSAWVFVRVTKIIVDRRKNQRLLFSYDNEIIFDDGNTENADQGYSGL